MTPLRTVFMGTPELAEVSLRALLHTPDCRVVAVVTQPDQPKGRGLKLQASPVKQAALLEHLPVLQPEKARDEHFIRELQLLAPDLIVVTAFGQILPRPLLELPRLGCLNVHTSLLPKFRGAAPIQWAILNGESETGVTIMKLDAGVDTGDILAQETTPIHSSDDAWTLQDRLGKLGAELLVRTIPAYRDGIVRPRPQPAEGISHAPRIKKQDGRIDWTQPATAVWNRVRAMVPWPGAFTRLADPPAHRLKILAAEVAEFSGPAGEILRVGPEGIVCGCGKAALRILSLQREGGRPLKAREFLSGCPLKTGQRFLPEMPSATA